MVRLARTGILNRLLGLLCPALTSRAGSWIYGTGFGGSAPGPPLSLANLTTTPCPTQDHPDREPEAVCSGAPSHVWGSDIL